MFPYEWKMADGYPAPAVDPHGLKVFTTFACGGGSSMGYKLAGYDVIAANDIDPQMEKVYKENHHPKNFFLASVKELLDMELPQELYDIDVLDGSPPCSVFSVAGLREEAWQEQKHFREGQAAQVLDDLFFDFVKLAEKLRPKIVIAENVKGMLLGNAKWYTREVHRQFVAAGYKGKVVLLNSATMGVPQKRERVFFIYTRADLNLPDPVIGFEEPTIVWKDVRQDEGTVIEEMTPLYQEYWRGAGSRKPVGKFNARRKIGLYQIPLTINASVLHFDSVAPRMMFTEELIRCGSFPTDYNFCGIKPHYLIGMSVPPVMMAQVAYSVYEQIGRKLIERREAALSTPA